MHAHPHVLIVGYYGFHNAGDDAVLFGILQALKTKFPGLQATVLSNAPEETARTFGIRAVNRWRPGPIIRAIRAADFVVVGGGTLLQDRTSPRSPLYYLGITELAKRFGKPVFYYGQGFGPIVHASSRFFIRRVLSGVDLIIMRDAESARELEKTGVRGVPIAVTADPALAIDPAIADRERGRAVLADHGRTPKRPLAVVSVRPWKDRTAHLLPLARALDRVADRGFEIVFIAMQRAQDVEPALRVRAAMTRPAAVVRTPLDFRAIFGVIAEADLLIGMRLHALIFAALHGVPFVPLSYDPKIDRFVESVGLVPPLSIEALQADALMERIEATMNDLPALRRTLADRVPPVVDAARRSADLVYDAYRSRARRRPGKEARR
ncbi:polysaccharide pyruvyl transferase CsaB [Hydrogenibacillus sp. N12]|uniref:polysaccharide pyruvyl transferase CsaB n=1 Tax=Hydrogenibacillus sp. N12 TaxID=2866627 RepID=UPI001C7D1F89|nr:polysaccharide pyruvyl transferase CsaB [Hydrogenibacillus sp. N12]QZA32412.1 polysaccharide pyruvyl transferase CsaB [Hydrogenibacillus sp. N12]